MYYKETDNYECDVCGCELDKSQVYGDQYDLCEECYHGKVDEDEDY